MGLFDVIDDIAERQVLKTESGDNRIFGVVTGTVTKNYDKKMPGRVCVEIPSRDSEANELRWARIAFPYGGKDWGYYFVPEVGDQVLVAFEQGNIEKPYVVGCIYKDSDKMLTKYVDEKNQYKSIVTKNGNIIKFTDAAEEEGEGASDESKEKIEILTGQKEHQIILDNERDSITITDKEKNNYILISTQKDNGTINIKAQRKLTIKVGDKIELIMNGENGAVTLNASKLKVSCEGSVDMEGQSKMMLKGASVTAEATASMTVSSAGSTSIGGTPIKIG